MFKKIFSLIMAIFMVATAFSSNVYAFDDSVSAQLKGTNYYVQSNVWMSTTHWRWTHSYKVSAKLYKDKSLKETANANTIKSTWNFKATGIGVSLSGEYGGVSAGAAKNGFSGSWENNNTWISDMSGTFKISGFPICGTLSNTAFAIKNGAKAQATAECFRVY